ncbi:hypothetical protein GCM10009836_11900 [Pseudonocardia ailaonensis]|uniref:CDP-alcohol phosphatidyltransferase n=1 Tax=Pseudonocardia ailaonensis TaxID=367279 RepID=A0ABN2MRT2_9PSEU
MTAALDPLRPSSTVVDGTTRPLVAAAVGLVALLSALGPGPVGWAAGAGYGAALIVLLAGAARRAGAVALGPADLVTLSRAVLIGGVAALVADHLATGAAPVWLLVPVASVALALDFVDGKVARHTGTVSALGARFDMEVDAVAVLVLSVYAATLLGPWTLAIGAMRYAYVGASWLLPWLRGSLPTRWSAKVVAAVQGIALVVAISGVLPVAASIAIVAVALALLTWSFGQSVGWLWRHRPVPSGRGDAGPVVPAPRVAP